MFLTITDNKGLHHTLNAGQIKMIEFSKKSVRIIWKDGRTPDVNISSSQIMFHEGAISQ